MGQHQHQDRTITARLQGAACRLAGWVPPTGEARAAAVEELRAIATMKPQPQRGSPHVPLGQLRGDLLAEAAGLLLGTAPLDHPQRNRGAAELLMEAGADRGLLDHWIGVGRARAAKTRNALKDPSPGHRRP